LIAQGVEVGDYLRDRLRELAGSQALIGDVRGFGMLTGLEFVLDRTLRSPATEETLQLLELMREQQILVGEEGRDSNILKLRPPLVFEKKHADRLVDGLDACLSRLSG
jgi:4-aminobutyrate aminotransferase-like enzyme